MAESVSNGVEAADGSGVRRVGALTIAAGASFIIAALGSIATEWAWLVMLIGFALLAYAVPNLHAYQAPADGWAGTWGSRLVLVGAAVVLALGAIFLVWEAVGEPGEPEWVGVLWMVGFFSFVLGIVLFAVGTMRANRVPRAAPAVMLGGLVGALLIDMATGAFFEDEGTTTEWGFYIGVPVFGLGLAWIGYSVWAERSRPEVAA